MPDEKSGGFVDNAVDMFFAMKKELLVLGSFVLLALVLRIVAAINITVNADDMVHALRPINFLSAGRLITWNESSGLWHAVTSVFYQLLGVTQLSSRFAAILFGTFSVIAIYLLTKEFFGKKAGYFAAFLLAISPFHIKNTLAESDVMALFFVLIGMFVFIKALKTDKTKLFAIAGLFIGLAIYTKTYPLLFVPSLLVYFYYSRRKEGRTITTEQWKKVFAFLIIAGLFAIPALTHNYLLYKDKGIMDMQFTRTFGFGENTSAQYYSWDPIWGQKNSWAGLFVGDTHHVAAGTPLLLAALGFIFKGDFVISLLALFAILLLVTSKRAEKRYLPFFLAAIIFILPFLASIMLLPKHYIFLDVLIIPLAGFGCAYIHERITAVRKKDATLFIGAVVLLSSLALLGNISSGVPHFYTKSEVPQVINFKENSISQNALIIGDSRIYRGRSNFMFYGWPYLETADFITILGQQESIPGSAITAEVYYFECVSDDCGWGTIRTQPEFNASMEQFTASFANQSTLLTTIYAADYSKKTLYPFTNNKVPAIHVYKSSIQLKKGVIDYARQPKNWFLYDIGYGREQFDSYTTHNPLDAFLNAIAHWIVLLAVILALASPLYVIWLVASEKD